MNLSSLISACLLLFSFVCTSLPGFSQDVGVRGGLNVTNTGGDSGNLGWKPDFHAGAFLADDLALGLGYFVALTYSRQGAQFDRSIVNDLKINNNYINLSALLSYRLSEKWKVLAGPRVGMLVNGTIDFPGFLEGSTTESLSAFNLSAALEAQYKISEKLFLYTGYAHGLTSNVANDNPNPGRFPDRVFQLGVAMNILSGN